MSAWRRLPAVAGRFYDGDAHRLRRRVGAWLAPVPQVRDARLRGLIAPHAGHVYSGPVAASGYRLVEPARWHRVLAIGPAHFAPVRGVAASTADAWTTPLGTVPLDTAGIGTLVAGGIGTLVAGGSVEYDDEAHAAEHCLEVQLPFLQVALGTGWTFVPLLVGHAGPDRVADVLDDALDPDTLLLVSTDLSHYLRYADAARRDAETARHIVDRDVARVGDHDACGAYALRGALAWARRHDVGVELLDLRNSGDTAGGRDRVVGYGAFALRA